MTTDALLAAGALLLGVLLKAMLDLFGWLGQQRFERKRLLATARREAYRDLLVAVGRYNSSMERLATIEIVDEAGLSDSEQRSREDRIRVLSSAREAAADDLRRSVLSAQLVSQPDVASQLQSVLQALSGSDQSISFSAVFEPLRRELNSR